MDQDASERPRSIPLAKRVRALSKLIDFDNNYIVENDDDTAVFSAAICSMRRNVPHIYLTIIHRRGGKYLPLSPTLR